MKTIDERFRAWMDDHKLRAEVVGRALDVSPQTIRNWRADAIPPRRHEAVLRVMREWDVNPMTQVGSRLSIQATDEQFRSWNKAALDAGKLIEEWAREGLDGLAGGNHLDTNGEHEPLRSVPRPLKQKRS